MAARNLSAFCEGYALTNWDLERLQPECRELILRPPLSWNRILERVKETLENDTPRRQRAYPKTHCIIASATRHGLHWYVALFNCAQRKARLIEPTNSLKWSSLLANDLRGIGFEVAVTLLDWQQEDDNWRCGYFCLHTVQCICAAPARWLDVDIRPFPEDGEEDVWHQLRRIEEDRRAEERLQARQRQEAAERAKEARIQRFLEEQHVTRPPATKRSRPSRPAADAAAPAEQDQGGSDHVILEDTPAKPAPAPALSLPDIEMLEVDWDATASAAEVFAELNGSTTAAEAPAQRSSPPRKRKAEDYEWLYTDNKPKAEKPTHEPSETAESLWLDNPHSKAEQLRQKLTELRRRFAAVKGRPPAPPPAPPAPANVPPTRAPSQSAKSVSPPRPSPSPARHEDHVPSAEHRDSSITPEVEDHPLPEVARTPEPIRASTPAPDVDAMRARLKELLRRKQQLDAKKPTPLAELEDGGKHSTLKPPAESRVHQEEHHNLDNTPNRPINESLELTPERGLVDDDAEGEKRGDPDPPAATEAAKSPHHESPAPAPEESGEAHSGEPEGHEAAFDDTEVHFD